MYINVFKPFERHPGYPPFIGDAGDVVFLAIYLVITLFFATIVSYATYVCASRIQKKNVLITLVLGMFNTSVVLFLIVIAPNILKLISSPLEMISTVAAFIGIVGIWYLSRFVIIPAIVASVVLHYLSLREYQPKIDE